MLKCRMPNGFPGWSRCRRPFLICIRFCKTSSRARGHCPSSARRMQMTSNWRVSFINRFKDGFMKKIIMVMALACALCTAHRSQAQAQEAAQLLLNVEKLRQLEEILDNMYKG